MLISTSITTVESNMRILWS